MDRRFLHRRRCCVVYGILALFIAFITYQSTQPIPHKPAWRTFEATAYTADCRGCIGITKTGVDVKQTQYDEIGRRVIAVDPAVVPLGSTVEVRLDNGFTFTAVAADTGGAIDGAEIDVLVAEEDHAIEFGRQDVQIRIVKGAD